MAKNRHFAEGNQVSIPVPAGVVSGEAVRIGALNGVALTDRGEQTVDEATVQFDGAFRFELDGPIGVGDPVTVTQVAGQVAGTGAGGGDTFGHALQALANGETAEIPVRVANPIP